jgi:hypothetical protein
MSRMKSKQVSVRIDADARKRLAQAADALSSVASAYIHACDGLRARPRSRRA